MNYTHYAFNYYGRKCLLYHGESLPSKLIEMHRIKNTDTVKDSDRWFLILDDRIVISTPSKEDALLQYKRHTNDITWEEKMKRWEKNNPLNAHYLGEFTKEKIDKFMKKHNLDWTDYNKIMIYMRRSKDAERYVTLESCWESTKKDHSKGG